MFIRNEKAIWVRMMQNIQVFCVFIVFFCHVVIFPLCSFICILVIYVFKWMNELIYFAFLWGFGAKMLCYLGNIFKENCLLSHRTEKSCWTVTMYEPSFSKTCRSKWWYQWVPIFVSCFSEILVIRLFCGGSELRISHCVTNHDGIKNTLLC